MSSDVLAIGANGTLCFWHNQLLMACWLSISPKSAIHLAIHDNVRVKQHKPHQYRNPTASSSIREFLLSLMPNEINQPQRGRVSSAKIIPGWVLPMVCAAAFSTSSWVSFPNPNILMPAWTTIAKNLMRSWRQWRALHASSCRITIRLVTRQFYSSQRVSRYLGRHTPKLWSCLLSFWAGEYLERLDKKRCQSPTKVWWNHVPLEWWTVRTLQRKRFESSWSAHNILV